MTSLSYEDAVELPISTGRRLYAFDGRSPHEVKRYDGDVSNRLSIIFFLSARGWKAEPPTTARLRELGFVPASDSEDASSFESRFDVLTAGMTYTSWKVSGD